MLSGEHGFEKFRVFFRRHKYGEKNKFSLFYFNAEDNHIGRPLNRVEQVRNSGNNNMKLIKRVIKKSLYHQVYKRSNLSPKKYLNDILLEKVVTVVASSTGDMHGKEKDIRKKKQQLNENHHVPSNATPDPTTASHNGMLYNSSVQSPSSWSDLTSNRRVSPSLSSTGHLSDALHRQSQSVSGVQPSTWTTPKHTSGLNGSSVGVSLLHFNSSCECVYISVCSFVTCVMVGEACGFYLKHCNAILHQLN